MKRVCAVALLIACGREHPSPRPERPESAAWSSTMATLTPGLRVVRAASQPDAAHVVAEAVSKAKSESRRLVVYVGATWCEPCKRFHDAAKAGALDRDFPDVTMLEFDLDEDRQRLAADGYAGQFVPLFVLPDATGHASSRKFEGSIKGEGAVANITPRLRSLLVP
jgi:hypothetical protein